MAEKFVATVEKVPCSNTTGGSADRQVASFTPASDIAGSANADGSADLGAALGMVDRCGALDGLGRVGAGVAADGAAGGVVTDVVTGSATDVVTGLADR